MPIANKIKKLEPLSNPKTQLDFKFPKHGTIKSLENLKLSHKLGSALSETHAICLIH